MEAPETDTWAQLVDELLTKHVEPDLQQPTILFDYPVELSPFAKRHRSEEGLVERFEAFAGGMEIANAFSELNDPDEQRRRFEAQRADAEAGDEETQPLRRGFRSARWSRACRRRAAWDLGIDRLVMLLTGAARSARSCCSPPCAKSAESGLPAREPRCPSAAGW